MKKQKWFKSEKSEREKIRRKRPKSAVSTANRERTSNKVQTKFRNKRKYRDTTSEEEEEEEDDSGGDVVENDHEQHKKSTITYRSIPFKR